MCVQGRKKLMVATLEPGDHEHAWTLVPDFRFKSLLYHLLGPSVYLSVK